MLRKKSELSRYILKRNNPESVRDQTTDSKVLCPNRVQDKAQSLKLLRTTPIEGAAFSIQKCLYNPIDSYWKYVSSQRWVLGAWRYNPIDIENSCHRRWVLGPFRLWRSRLANPFTFSKDFYDTSWLFWEQAFWNNPNHECRRTRNPAKS